MLRKAKLRRSREGAGEWGTVMLRMLMVISSDDKQQEGLLRSFDSHHLHDEGDMLQYQDAPLAELISK